MGVRTDTILLTETIFQDIRILTVNKILFAFSLKVSLVKAFMTSNLT
ncbi:hypothetical protein CZ794_01830 [Psychrobacter sp. JB385]|nr:hypothetical protein CZ794_01830 [Psychrobacter sp. JB385]